MIFYAGYIQIENIVITHNEYLIHTLGHSSRARGYSAGLLLMLLLRLAS